MRKINNKWKFIVLTSILLVLSITILLFFPENNNIVIDNASNKRVYKYSFTIQNPGNRFVEEVSFWTYSPRKLSANQKLVHLNVSQPMMISIEDDGNEKLNFVVKNIPPFGSKVVSISAELNFSNIPNKTTGDDLKKYLRQDVNIESEDPKIISLSKQLISEKPESTLANIFQWINENITDSGFIERDHGALYALANKRGDCTEFMNLFVALARASNIPARGIAGYVYPESAVMHPKDYHNWVEVYLDGVWRVIDPLNKVFLEKEQQYISMRLLGSAREGDNTQRFFGNDKSVRVTMN